MRKIDYHFRNKKKNHKKYQEDQDKRNMKEGAEAVNDRTRDQDKHLRKKKNNKSQN